MCETREGGRDGGGSWRREEYLSPRVARKREKNRADVSLRQKNLICPSVFRDDCFPLRARETALRNCWRRNSFSCPSRRISTGWSAGFEVSTKKRSSPVSFSRRIHNLAAFTFESTLIHYKPPPLSFSAIDTFAEVHYNRYYWAPKFSIIVLIVTCKETKYINFLIEMNLFLYFHFFRNSILDTYIKYIIEL